MKSQKDRTITKNIKKVFLFVSLWFFTLSYKSSVFAQGCAMCKTSIAGSADAAKTAFKINIGVLVLLVPVAGLFIAIFSLVYRYRDSVITEDAEPSEQLLSVFDSSTERSSFKESLQ